MSPTAKDFVAEATDIANHLSAEIPSHVLTAYVQQRCATLYAANPLFDRDRFTNMAYGIETGETTGYEEIRDYGLTKLVALERLATLRSVLDQHRVIPSRVSVGHDPFDNGPDSYGYFIQWRGNDFLRRSMMDSLATLRTVHHG